MELELLKQTLELQKQIIELQKQVIELLKNPIYYPYYPPNGTITFSTPQWTYTAQADGQWQQESNTLVVNTTPSIPNKHFVTGLTTKG